MKRSRRENERDYLDRQKKKKKTKFEDEQDRLDILCLTINDKQNYYYDYYNFILKFECAKFSGKTNILRLYPHLSSIKVMNFIGNNKDSLFLHKNYNSYIYISPHFLYINQSDGRCLTEFISQQEFLTNKVVNVVMIPTQTIRSHDNYCIEYFDNKNISDNEYYNLLGDYLNNNNINRYTFILQLFSNFIDNILFTFKETKYLPYMIHPDRLILLLSKLEENSPQSIKLASLNLLSYIFSPQNDKEKILNATFSHPISFLENKEEIDIEKKLIIDIVYIILDFFHSAFVTSLWILTCGQYQYLTKVKRNSFNDIRAPIKINKEKFTNIEKDWKYCNNDFGFCRNFDKKKKIIHNFGCLHLMQVMPIILQTAMEDSHQSLSFREVENCIQTCTMLFKEFLTNIIREDDDDDDEDEEEEEKKQLSS